MINQKGQLAMKKEVLQFPEIGQTNLSFNHVIKVGNLLFLTSQLSCDLKSGNIIHGNLEEQTKNALENIKYLLERADSSMQNIVKVTIYMRNIRQFSIMEKVYREYVDAGNEPARTTVNAASPIKGIDIEIEATALTNT